MDLSGLSAVPGGVINAQGALADLKIKQLNAQVATDELATLDVLARSLGQAPPSEQLAARQQQAPQQGVGQLAGNGFMADGQGGGQPAPQMRDMSGLPTGVYPGGSPQLIGAAGLRTGGQEQPTPNPFMGGAVPGSGTPPNAQPGQAATQAPAPNPNPYMPGGGQGGGQQPRALGQQGGGQPQQGGGQPQQGGGQPQGVASLQQAAQFLMRDPRNAAAIRKNPRLLIGALEKMQHLLAPEAKQELAEAKQQLAQQKAQMDYDAKLQAIEGRYRDALAAATSREQVANVNAARAEAVANIQAAAKVQGITINMEGRKDITATTEAGKDRRQEVSEGGKDRRADTKSRADIVKMATKAGVTVSAAMETDEIQSKTAEAMAKKGGVSGFSPETAAFIGEAARKDPTILSRIGGGTVGTANKAMVFDYLAKNADPTELAAARVAMAGNTAEAGVIGKQAGNVALGVEEIGPLGQKVMQASKKVPLTSFPTVNSIIEAAQKGSGGTAVIELANYIQGLKSAYTQVLIRSGQNSVHAQQRADELIDKNYSRGQMQAGINAMIQEGKIAEAAAAKARGKVQSSITGKTPAATPDAGGGGASTADDPLGIR